MGKVLKQKLVKKLQNIFWIYLTNNFIINNMNDFRTIVPGIQCDFTPITLYNYHRVGDFREKNRISEYKDKLALNEIGFFAEHKGKMVGSIWATLNKSKSPAIIRTYMKLMPNTGLIHDIVTSEKSRGIGVGPFMVSRIAPILLTEYGMARIIIDVNTRNSASLRMMDKVGLCADHKMLSVSAFGRLVLRKTKRSEDSSSEIRLFCVFLLLTDLFFY